MANLSFPFDSVLKDGKPDRVYFAEDFADYFEQFISNGVYPDPATGLQVVSNTSMEVTVKAGAAFIRGYCHLQKEDQIFAINTADAGYTRKDIMVVQLDLINRTMEVRYKNGIAGANPQEPALIRTTDIYELKLASIQVRASTQSITQSDITDTRLNSDVCGVVTNLVQTVDTSQIFAQYQDFMADTLTAFGQDNAVFKQKQGEQLATNQARYDVQYNTIENWYQSVKVDIAKLQTFDFDNIAALHGVTKTTAFNVEGSITETIKMTATNKKVADRLTVFHQDGSITVDLTVYNTDGTTVLKQSSTHTIFNGDGSITEVVA